MSKYNDYKKELELMNDMELAEMYIKCIFGEDSGIVGTVIAENIYNQIIDMMIKRYIAKNTKSYFYRYDKYTNDFYKINN